MTRSSAFRYLEAHGFLDELEELGASPMTYGSNPYKDDLPLEVEMLLDDDSVLEDIEEVA